MEHISRRAVLQSAPLLLATLVRCSNAVAGRARVAEAFIVDPSWSAYRPVLRGVITALLPFETAGFPPITSADIEQRLIRLFPIEKELQFLGLQRTIALFDEIDLFQSMSGPLAQEESKARDLLARGGDVKRVVAEIAAADAVSFAVFARASGAGGFRRFRDLPLAARRAYLELWHDSASIVKRHFFDSLRALVMVTTWSMDATWPSIGYAGPLLPRKAMES
ncbi:MAG: hypothetical protein QOF63_315 [Thermoanaerobaculia bacterium]|nr:hypothetical protein [Thermoanaerobaculia bacterium]